MTELCELCEELPSEYTCRICGRLVCRLDYVLNEGICVVCKSALCEVCGRELSVAVCKMCGRLVCELCSVEDGPARICKLCISGR
ncbi:MAG: hypothetical protein DRJ40_01915 [Thermoprotei archaeon]|nr:MAG: hypothetical protein DRJ40_01915 [Thermoprotei archaeon]